MNQKKRAQIAMEYLILTAFIVLSVAIIFTFSFVNYSQNIKIAQANEMLSKMANAANDIYARGEGNNRFVNISVPDGTGNITIFHKCVEGQVVNQGTLDQCSLPAGPSYDYVEFSVIAMELQLLGGTNVLMRETNAKVGEVLGEIALLDGGGPLNKYAGSGYPVKVSWLNDDAVKFEKV